MKPTPAMDPGLASTWRGFILESMRQRPGHWLDTSELVAEALRIHAGPVYEAAWVKIPHVLSDLERAGTIERKGRKILTAQWRKR